MNEVAVARHGPTLNDKEATVSRKVFKYLPGLRDIILRPKMVAEVKNTQTPYFTVYFNMGCTLEYRPMHLTLNPINICIAMDSVTPHTQ